MVLTPSKAHVTTINEPADVLDVLDTRGGQTTEVRTMCVSNQTSPALATVHVLNPACASHVDADFTALQDATIHAQTESSELDAYSAIRRILLALGAKPQHIQYALERAQHTNESLPVIMGDFGLVSPEIVAQAIAMEQQLGYFAPSEIHDIDSLALQPIIPADHFRHYIPVALQGKHVTIAIPDMQHAASAKNEFHHLIPKMVIASTQTIQTIYRQYFARTENDFDTALAMYEQAVAENTDDKNPGLVQNILGCILRHACYAGASDVFFMKTQRVGIIKIKNGGVGAIFRSIKPEIYDKLMQKMVMDNCRDQNALLIRPQSGLIEFKTDADKNRFEDIVSRYGFRLELAEPRPGKREATIRILDRQSNEADFDSLQFDDRTATILKRFTASSGGLCLITGQVGSGKTTTLYSLLKLIDAIENHIYTIEHPIEMPQSLWSQHEINKEGEISEGTGAEILLNSALRCAIDVLFFGELRNDTKLASLLLDGANVGARGFATMHANDAASALNRIRNMGVDIPTLADVLDVILAQRLVRMLCRHCKVSDDTVDTQTALQKSWLNKVDTRPMKATGCAHCKWMGYRGRAMVYEVMEVTRPVRALIEQGAPISEITAITIKDGQSIWDSGLRLVAAGITSMEELRRVVRKR